MDQRNPPRLRPFSRPVSRIATRPDVITALRSLIGGFVGIGLVAGLAQHGLADTDLTLMIGAFGATAVLLYGTPTSPFAQPYNVLVGHVLSALIGVSVYLVLGQADWLAAALAVSLAIFAMQITRSVHPPGGASALIAVAGSPEIHAMGYSYAVLPVGLGALALLLVALVVNNIGVGQHWPRMRP